MELVKKYESKMFSLFIQGMDMKQNSKSIGLPCGESNPGHGGENAGS